MPPRLLLADPLSVQDALTFAARAARSGEDAVRLQASGGTLAMTAAPLAPRGLLDQTPTVLALRAVRADPELVCDLVVVASALRAADDDPHAIELPDTAISAAWAGITPPRAGWTDVGVLAADVLAARAQWGSAAVAHALPQDPGEEIVRIVRGTVWGEPDPDLDDLPRGVAFVAFTMGFIGGAELAPVRRSGPWTRISLARGHVLARGPVKSGLTAVRSTG